jgi:hypothetical protein
MNQLLQYLPYLITPVVIAVWILCFWYLYILVMGLYRANMDKRLSGLTLWLAYPAVAVGYFVDLISNWTIASILFLEPPRFLTELVTDRLSRYIKSGTGYRKAWAMWICQNLLDFFDPRGSHCGD